MGIRSWLRRRDQERLVWFGTGEGAVLADLQTGKVAGHFWHDGIGEWEVRICVSIWRAWRMSKNYPTAVLSFADFTRRWMLVLRAHSVAEALGQIEEIVGPSLIHTCFDDSEDDG